MHRFMKSPTVKPMRTWPVWWQSRPEMLHLCSKSQHNVGIASTVRGYLALSALLHNHRTPDSPPAPDDADGLNNR